MSTLPRFVYPTQTQSGPSEPICISKERPCIQLDTNTEQPLEEYHLTVPQLGPSRPIDIRTLSTPPDSPICSTATSQTSVKMHDSGAITPPATPTKATHGKTSSASSDFLNTISCLRRGDSISSPKGRSSLDKAMRPGSTEPIYFPYHPIDYKYQTDEEGRKKPIGVGAWSDVYLAKPSIAEPATEFAFHAPAGPALTPPITPTHSRTSSIQGSNVPSSPLLYAVKVPGSTSAKKVLNAETRILSYLSRFPDADKHIVSFYGQDTRNNALILKAMDGTLEDWTHTHLNTLSESSRATKLASIFPSIALSLINSLIFMHSKSCIHADIKPSNILFSLSSSPIPTLVYSDFSSTILTTSSPHSAPPPPLGAGTWTYLDPSLLSSLHPTTPSAATDVWSLAITLLTLVLGVSPYDAFTHNTFQMREMVKAGMPLDCMAYDDAGRRNVRRVRLLSEMLGWDVQAWLGKVLRKKIDSRVGLDVWSADVLEMGMGMGMGPANM